MKRLKIVLQSKHLYFILGIILFLYIICYVNIVNYHSNYENNTYIEGKIIEYKIKDNKVTFILKNKFKYRCYYYLKEGEVFSNLGKIVKIKGVKKDIINNTIPNTFNYKNYLSYHHFNDVIEVSVIEELSQENIFYKIKDSIIRRVSTLNNDEKITNYLSIFILGINNFDTDLENMYQLNGIWHLFSISGMHISLFLNVLKKLFSKIKHSQILIGSILWLYAFVVGFKVSVLRVIMFYFLKNIFSFMKIEISNLKILLLVTYCFLFVNPYYIYDTAFLYSFIISFSLIIENIKDNQNYFWQIFKISLISYLASLPITINIRYEINLLGIFLNVLYVPFISLFLFPCSFLSFLVPIFLPIFKLGVSLLEISNNFFVNLSLTLIIPKISIILIFIYYFLFLLFLIKKENKYFLFLIFILFLNILIPKFNRNYYVYYLDVLEGDCAVLISPYRREVIMIDTGGDFNSSYHISDKTILFLKSMGIKKIDLLILSHGDYDHAYETLNLLEKFSIKNIILNKNEINDLEKEIIQKGNVVNDYQSKYFIWQNIYDYVGNNENDSSIITYLKIYNYSFLFMGDSSKSVERKLINDYKIKCDFLKVGHHGSKTSTDQNFITMLDLKYAIISVGRNNFYGHPAKDVLNVLKNIKVLRTDVDGSIEIKIAKNKLKIKLYSP